VLNGTYDAAFTWTTKGDGYGQIRTMIDKGMLKREQIRVIWESALVPPHRSSSARTCPPI
jgi:phosphonate transport system substrate-binding protein